MEFLVGLILFIFAVAFYARMWGLSDQLAELVKLAREEKEDRQAMMRRQIVAEIEAAPAIARKPHAAKIPVAAAVVDPNFEAAIAEELGGKKLR